MITFFFWSDKQKPALRNCSNKTMSTQKLGLVIVLIVCGLSQYRTSAYLVTNTRWTQAQVNNRPIIGIVALDTTSKYGKTFISSTYVKYLEQAGARVVPIKGGQPDDYYSRMVDYTNGILLPGGAVNFATSLYGRSAKLIYERALAINKAGDFYPIWGTCMGFQILCYLTQGQNLLQATDSDNITLPLNFEPNFRASRMFRQAPEDIIQFLKTENITQNEHHYSILNKVFDSSKLSSFFTKISTSRGRKGVQFISTVEAKEFPIYGTQWHPEKNNFNWNPNYDINHSDHAVKVSQYMADFFVSQARKSRHRFPNLNSEVVNLIQNYKLVYYTDGSFNDLYFIDV